MSTTTKIILGILGIAIGYGAYRTFKTHKYGKWISESEFQGKYQAVNGDVWEATAAGGGMWLALNANLDSRRKAASVTSKVELARTIDSYY